MANGTTKKRQGELATARYFSAPVLLDGEDPAAYAALRDDFLDCVKPQDIFEQAYLRGIIDVQWDIMRWRRLLAALLNSEKHAAVRDIFGPIIGFEKAREIYNGCAKQDPAMM